MADKNGFIGRQIGSYKLVEKIGKGGYGSVYRAEHSILTNRVVAIKLLQEVLFNSDQERDRFKEAIVLEALQHPNILHLIDVGVDENLLYLITEYAAGGSLWDRLQHQFPQPLPLTGALDILSQIGQAVQYAHQKHIIHRDLKPQNILFDAQDKVLLADFGIATILADTPVKNTAHIVGTPAYMAPEQFKGQNSAKSDQYALGCIAYELFTGRKPFNLPLNANWWTWADKHSKELPPDPIKLNPHLPAHFKQVIQRAMAKEPDNRYPNISAFVTALSAFPSQLPTHIMPQAVPPLPPLSKTSAMTRGSTFNPPQKTIEQWLDVGEEHFNAERFNDALTVYEQIISFDSKSANAYYGKGKVLKVLKHLPEAIAAYDQAIYLNPKFALAYIGKGDVYRDAFKNHKEALINYQQAVRVAPTSALGYYNMGNAHNDLEQYEEAIAAYDAAIRCEPNFLDAYYRKGELLENQKHYEEALSTYDKALSIVSNSTDAHYRKGELLERLKRYEEALSVWEKLINKVPNFADAYYRKGQALVALEQQKGQKYKELYRKAEPSISRISRLNQQRLRGFREKPESDILEVFERNQRSPLYPRERPEPIIPELPRRRRQSLEGVGKESELNISELLKPNQQKLEEIHEKQELGILEALEARLAPKLRYKEALDAYEHAIDLRPNYPSYYKAKGDALKYLGRIKEANQAYKKGAQLENNDSFAPIKIDKQLRLLKEHEGILIFSAMNPLLLPIILGALLQSWWALGGSFLGGLALFALYLWLRNQLSNSSNIVSVSLAAFLIAIGWSVVGWFFGLSLQGVPLVFAIACFIVGFFGNAFIFYIIDEWSIWKL
ncbi:MAG TPA: protein kinase [Ktedonobacteraceae bacterium]|nr:protein kinase [Ktedonobacteraceae bacterium]